MYLYGNALCSQYDIYLSVYALFISCPSFRWSWGVLEFWSLGRWFEPTQGHVSSLISPIVSGICLAEFSLSNVHENGLKQHHFIIIFSGCLDGHDGNWNRECGWGIPDWWFPVPGAVQYGVAVQPVHTVLYVHQEAVDTSSQWPTQQGQDTTSTRSVQDTHLRIYIFISRNAVHFSVTHTHTH